MILDWPEGIYPKSQSFYIRHRSTRFLSTLTGQFDVLEREGARWVAEFTFELENTRARKLDALIAELRGAVGKILVPDFRRLTARPVTLSMDDYADEVGLTFFDDHYDFDDDTNDDGFLTTEESPPLGAEDNALFGGGFDAVLIFYDETTLLTEAGLMLLADNVGIFAPKPKQAKFSAPSVTSISTGSRGRTEMVNQPITAHRIVYGRTRVSGPLVFTHSRPVSGSDNKLDMLHWVIVLAAHEVEEIEDILFNDETVPLDGNGAATSEPYKRDGTVYASIYKHLGASDQTADQVLVDNSGGQWTNAHRLRGLAYIHAEMRYDDKAYAGGTPNISAIVKGRKIYDPRLDDYAWSDNAALCVLDYLLSDFGLGASAEEIDMNSFIAAANVCDETVATLDATEKRYTCNGVVDLNDSARDVLESMLGSCAGYLTYTGGKWRLQVGAYYEPVKTFDESFLRDAVVMRPHRSRRQLFNAIKGAFVSPDHNWQATDYPAVASDLYITEDSGEEIISTLDLSFTTSHTMAQRIAKIALEQIRRQRQIQYPANLAGFQVMAGNTVAVDLTRFGINGLPCRVVNWQMTEEMGVDLTLDEDGENIYAFTQSDLKTIGDAPQVVVPNNQSVPPHEPNNVTATAGENYITISWDRITESDFRYVEVWERTSNTSDPETDAARILEVYDNSFTRNLLAGSETRYYWLRAVDRYGNKSDFAGPVEATTTGDQTVVLVLE